MTASGDAVVVPDARRRRIRPGRPGRPGPGPRHAGARRAGGAQRGRPGRQRRGHRRGRRGWSRTSSPGRRRSGARSPACRTSGRPRQGYSCPTRSSSGTTRCVAALDATDGLDLSWLRLSVGSVAASKMSTALAEHDRLVGQATERGRLAKYADALKLIDQAEAQLTTARGIRNQLVNTVDVTVLDEWIARNADVRRRAAQAVRRDLQGRQEGDAGDPGRGQGRGRRASPAPTGHPRPGGHHVRDRTGRDERRGHRHRGGARQAGRRDRQPRARRRRPSRTRRRRPTSTPRRRLDRTRPRPPDPLPRWLHWQAKPQPAERCPRGPGGRALRRTDTRATPCRHRSALGRPERRPRRAHRRRARLRRTAR